MNDASTAAHHAGHAVVGKVYVLKTYSAMDREIVNSLLTLFYKRVAEQLPGEVFSVTVHLFHGLIHGHSAYRDRTVAYYPLAGFVYVCSG